MKKMIALLLCMFLLAVSFVACGSKNEGEDTSDTKSQSVEQSESETEEDEEEGYAFDDPENPYGSAGGYAKLEWRLPENIEFSTENGEEEALMTGELLEVFRFFPDGGGSGSGHLEFKCGELARIFRITKLTGRLSVIDRDEYERELLQ